MTNAQRAALRRDLATAAQADGLKDEALKAFKAGLNTATVTRLMELATRYRVSIPAADAFATPPTPGYAEPLDAATPMPGYQEPAEAATPPSTPLDPVDATVQRLNDLWRDMDVAAFRDEIRTLAEAAHRPAKVVVTVSATGHVLARRTGTVPAGATFGVRGALATLPLPTYDAIDAPAIDPAYVLPADVMPALVSQLFKHRMPVWLAGPAGTGKTTLAEQIAARLGRPFSRISCTNTTEASTLVGMTVPAPGGGTVWQNGQLTNAISRPGCVVLIDEPSVARDGALYVFQSVLDTARAVYCDETGEVIRCADDVIFVLADNTSGSGDETGQYSGTRQVSRALLDRMGATITMDYPDPTTETAILAARTGAPAALCELLVAFARLTREQVTSGDLPVAVGPRRLFAWARLIMDGVKPGLAAHMAFVNSAPPDAQEPLRQLLATHASDNAVRATR